MGTQLPHLLIVDDNTDILILLQSMLTRREFRVSVKTSLSDPALTVELLNPDLMLIDMHLDGADGCALCRQIKSNPVLGHIPIVMITAYTEGKQDCLDAGADDFIEKPFDAQRILQTIRKVLRDENAPLNGIQ